MATNLETSIELAKIIEQQNKLYEQQTAMLKTQLGIMERLVETMDSFRPGDRTQEIEDLNDTLDTMSESMEDFGSKSSISNDTFNKLAESMLGNTSRMGDGMKKFGKAGMLLSPVVGVVSTLGGGFKFLFNTFKAGFSIAKTAIGSIVNLGMAVVAFPFNMLKGLIELADQQGDSGLRQQLEDIRKEFGSLKTGASKAIIDISRGMKGQLAETGLRARRIFGNLTETLAYFSEVATNMGPLFDKIRDSFVENGEHAGAYLKGLGLAAEGQKALAQSAVITGKSVQEIGREITTFAYGMGEAFGINGKTISRDVGNMMADVKNFGNMAPQTLANVSVFARKLGVEFTNLLGVVDQFDNFQTAAEGAAHLSQAFGLQLDTLSLITEQDPAARIEQLRKAFFAAGKSVENMTRQERALLAQQTGLDDSTLSLVFAQKNASTSYAAIQKQSDATKKKQLSQAEAMEKLADSIERMVKTMDSGKGGFFDRFLQGFSKGIRMSHEFRKVLKNLRHSLRIVFVEGKKVGRMFVEHMPGVKKFFVALQDLFDPKKMGDRMKKVGEAFNAFFQDLKENPKKALKDMLRNLNAIFFQGFDFKATFEKFKEPFMEFWVSVFNVSREAINIGIDSLFKLLNDKFKDEQGIGLGDKLKASFQETKEFLAEHGPVIVDIFVSISSATKQAAGVIVPFVKSLVDMVKNTVGLENVGKALGFLWIGSKFLKGAMLLGGLAGKVGDFADVLGGGAGGKGLGGVLKKLGPIAKKAFGFISLGLKAVMGAITANPIGAALAAIAAAAMLIIYNWDTIKEWFSKFQVWLGETWAKIKSGIIDAANAAIDYVKTNFPKMFEAINKGLEWVREKITTFAEATQKVFSFVRDVISGYFSAIKSIITGVFSVIKGVLTTYLGFIKGMMNKAADLIAPFSESIANKLRAGAKGVGEFSKSVSGALDTVSGKATGAVGSVAKGIDGMVANAAKGQADATRGMVNATLGAQKALQEGLKNGVESTRKSTEQQVKDAAKASKAITKGADGSKKGGKPETDNTNTADLSNVSSTVGSLGTQAVSRGQAMMIRRTLANIAFIMTGEPSKGQISYLDFMTDIKDKGIERLTTGATAMVAGINSAHTAIKGLKGVDLNADLKILNDKLGLGASKKLRIEQGNLQLNVTVNVKLDVEELEEVLTTRPGGARFLISDKNQWSSRG